MSEFISFFQSDQWLYLFIPVSYVILKRVLDQRFIKRRPRGDQECLATVASEGHCSEFEIFQRAAKQWRVGAPQAFTDFKIYLTSGQLPHYVRDYVRKNLPNRPTGTRSVIDMGGNLPSSWSA